MKLGIEEHVDEIVKVAETASKEYSIEQMLDKMIAEWANNLMDLSPYKNTGNYWDISKSFIHSQYLDRLLIVALAATIFITLLEHFFKILLTPFLVLIMSNWSILNGTLK